MWRRWWHLQWIAIVLVIAASIILQWPDEAPIRWCGTVLQLIGISTVAWGIGKTRKDLHPDQSGFFEDAGRALTLSHPLIFYGVISMRCATIHRMTTMLSLTVMLGPPPFLCGFCIRGSNG
jgi:hypothetical protein